MNLENATDVWKEIDSFSGSEDEVRELVRVLCDSEKIRPLMKSIYNKNKRPKPLCIQYAMLDEIASNQKLEAAHRINSAIAASHKAIESMERELVVRSREVASCLFRGHIDQVGFSDYIREDKTHIYFSYYSVLFHVDLWLGDIETIYAELADVKSFAERFENLTLGYYQTCTNAARVLSFYLFALVLKQEYKTAINVYSLINEVFYQGIIRSDDNRTKFAEYVGALKMLEHAKQVANTIRDVNLGAAPARKDKLDRQLLALISTCLRGHVPRKVAHIQANVEVLMSKGPNQ